MPEQLKVVTQSPENAETPLADVHSWVTPTRLFFVRNHFEVPELDVSTWRLAVGGCVGRPLVLTAATAISARPSSVSTDGLHRSQLRSELSPAEKNRPQSPAFFMERALALRSLFVVRDMLCSFRLIRGRRYPIARMGGAAAQIEMPQPWPRIARQSATPLAPKPINSARA